MKFLSKWYVIHTNALNILNRFLQNMCTFVLQRARLLIGRIWRGRLLLYHLMAFAWQTTQHCVYANHGKAPFAWRHLWITDHQFFVLLLSEHILCTHAYKPIGYYVNRTVFIANFGLCGWCLLCVSRGSCSVCGQYCSSRFVRDILAMIFLAVIVGFVDNCVFVCVYVCIFV